MKPTARQALEIATWQSIEVELRDILRDLTTPVSAAPASSAD
jgi:hypothetical protein